MPHLEFTWRDSSLEDLAVSYHSASLPVPGLPEAPGNHPQCPLGYWSMPLGLLHEVSDPPQPPPG